MTAILLPNGKQQYFTTAGLPAVGYKVATFAAGTSTPQTTWQDALKVAQQTNPIILDGRGEASIFWDGAYKVQLQDSTGAVIWTQDNLQSQPSFAVSLVPAVTNSVDLGSAALSWRNLYLGPNNAPALDTVSGNIGYYARTAAESAASVTPVNFVYPPYDLRRYGGDPTGVAASDTAMAHAIAVCTGTGGVIRAPVGTYLFNNPIVLTSRSGIVIEGDGCETIVAGAVTTLKYAGTGATNWIQINGSFGCGLQRLQLQNTLNTFSGSMMQVGSSNFCFTKNVTFNSLSGCSHLNLDTAVNFYGTECTFLGGANSVLGQNPSGASFSNVVIFTRCAWISCNSTPVVFGGNDWVFRDCTFEELQNGKAGAFTSNSATTPQTGILFEGCWFGDVTSGGNTWVLVIGSNTIGSGFVFHGNYIAGEASSTNALALQCNGISIVGNLFSTLTTAINFFGACTGVVVQANNFIAVTNQISNPSNIPASSLINPNSPQIPGNSRFFSLAANGFDWSQNGKMDQWFTANVSNGSNAITFPTAFPTACWNVVSALGTHQATTAVCYVTPGSVTASGFSLVVVDSAGTDTVYIRAVGN